MVCFGLEDSKTYLNVWFVCLSVCLWVVEEGLLMVFEVNKQGLSRTLFWFCIITLSVCLCAHLTSVKV